MNEKETVMEARRITNQAESLLVKHSELVGRVGPDFYNTETSFNMLMEISKKTGIVRGLVMTVRDN